jgi:hypothetical protein
VQRDADSKLIVSCLVGNRDAVCATEFVIDVASRLKNRVQLTTDGHKPYLSAAEAAFGSAVDYAMLQKIYGSPAIDEKRYSPAQCIGIKMDFVSGNPDPGSISTSYVERQNLTMRMQVRRFTRLTNGFSKKVENHAHSVALHFAYYNFVKIHQTLRVTPAMAAGITDRLWSIEDLLTRIDQRSGGMAPSGKSLGPGAGLRLAGGVCSGSITSFLMVSFSLTCKSNLN